MRGLLEDLGGGLGVTDPVSGESVLDLKPWTAPVATSARARPDFASGAAGTMFSGMNGTSPAAFGPIMIQITYRKRCYSRP